MKYRKDIDGLRAVAVVPVVFFHADFSFFSGGFVGVDVFFVISGYLITSIILSEMEKGEFHLANFYERRARRIFPALFLVMFASIPIGWAWLIPSDFKDFAQSLIFVSTFSSNILFWLESGYWDKASELKPLLHTWSLAVEEQYYVLFPLFLMLFWKFGKLKIYGIFAAISVASLAISQWGITQKPAATFYLLPTRGWEIAIGAGIAFFENFLGADRTRARQSRAISEVMSAFGLLLITYSVFTFDSTTPFPGVNALIPTVGTGLIILFSSPLSLAGRLLSSRPLVGIGLVSYSAYLWHQPLFAFAKHRIATEPHTLTQLILIFTSFLLAYLSWTYVEKPFRNKTTFSRRFIFSFSIVGLTIFLLVGIAGHITNGFQSRYLEHPGSFLLDFSTYDREAIYREGVCFLDPQQTHSDYADECFSSADEEDGLVFLWGDSHAAALSYGLRQKFRNLTQLTTSSCLPIVGYDPVSTPHCKSTNSFILDRIESAKPKLLILHANWILASNTTGSELQKELAHTISLIKPKSPNTRVIVIGGVPQWQPSLPELLLKNNIGLQTNAYVYSFRHDEIQFVDTELSLVAIENEAEFISLLSLFCENSMCLASASLSELYEPFAWDYGHLTRASSLLVTETILPILTTD